VASDRDQPGGADVWHGLREDTDNQFRDPVRGTSAYMWALAAAEISGFAVLLAGFISEQIL
jgi:hypothetical protein